MLLSNGILIELPFYRWYDRWRMVGLVVLLFAAWSSVFSFGKAMLQIAPPVFLTGARMTLAGVLILGFLLIRRKVSFRLTTKQWVSIGFLALFSIYLTNVLEFWGLQHLSSAKTCFIYSLSPFFAALFSYLHFKEKMTLTKWVGLSIGLVGFIPVLQMQTGSEELFSLAGFLSLPALAVMGAALFSVYGWVLLRLIVKDHEISPLVANGSSMLIGGLFALIHSFFIDSWNPLPVAEGKMGTFAWGIVSMTLLYNLVCYNAYGYMLRKYTATFLSFMGLLSPIFATLAGWALLGEKPSPYIFLSTAIVSIGLWLVYRSELKQGYVKKLS